AEAKVLALLHPSLGCAVRRRLPASGRVAGGRALLRRRRLLAAVNTDAVEPFRVELHGLGLWVAPPGDTSVGDRHSHPNCISDMDTIMTMRDRIIEKLTAAFAPAALDVVDESHLHAGHAGHRPGGE